MSVVAEKNFTCFDSPITFSVAVEHNDGSAVSEKCLQLGILKHETNIFNMAVKPGFLTLCISID